MVDGWTALEIDWEKGAMYLGIFSECKRGGAYGE